MKVKELIEKLQEFDGDLPVFINEEDEIGIGEWQVWSIVQHNDHIKKTRVVLNYINNEDD